MEEATKGFWAVVARFCFMLDPQPGSEREHTVKYERANEANVASHQLSRSRPRPGAAAR